MMADWQVGDLALCVSQEGPLVSGQTYTVSYVFWDDGDTPGCSPGWGVELSEYPYGWEASPEIGWVSGFDAWRFVKPEKEADEFDREVIALLTGKPEQVTG
jgi:hypothetical protein